MKWWEYFILNPNSSKALMYRAEKLEKDAEKLDDEEREGMLVYARLLREISLKDWTPAQNKVFIRENMRKQ